MIFGDWKAMYLRIRSIMRLDHLKDIRLVTNGTCVLNVQPFVHANFVKLMPALGIVRCVDRLAWTVFLAAKSTYRSILLEDW